MIEAKVIRILSDSGLIINAGRAHGVSRRTRFQVIGAGEEVIRDPESGEVLGTLLNEKASVSVTAVHESFCIAYTELVEAPGFDALAAALRPGRLVRDKFKVDPDDVAPLFQERDLTVRVGDKVRETSDAG